MVSALSGLQLKVRSTNLIKGMFAARSMLKSEKTRSKGRKRTLSLPDKQ